MTGGENISFRLNKFLIPSLARLDGDPSSSPSFSHPSTKEMHPFLLYQHLSPGESRLPTGNTTKLWRNQERSSYRLDVSGATLYCASSCFVFRKGEMELGFNNATLHSSEQDSISTVMPELRSSPYQNSSWKQLTLSIEKKSKSSTKWSM